MIILVAGVRSIGEPLNALGNNRLIWPSRKTVGALNVPAMQSFMSMLLVANTPPMTTQSSNVTASANMLPATNA